MFSSAASDKPVVYQDMPRLLYGGEGRRPGKLDHPHGVAVDPDTRDIHVADYINDRVNIYSCMGKFIQSYGSKASGGRGQSYPRGVTIDRHAHRIVTDDNHALSIYTRGGKLKKRFGKEGGGRGEYYHPNDVAADNAGLLYIADHGNSRVQVCNLTGEYVRMIGNTHPGRLQGPIYVALDGDGNVYVTDLHTKQVNIYTSSCQYKSSITVADVPQQDWQPCYVTIDCHRQLYVSDQINHCVHVLKNGRHIQQIGSKGNRTGCFKFPTGIALSRDGSLIVCDNHRIQVYDRIE